MELKNPQLSYTTPTSFLIIVTKLIFVFSLFLGASRAFLLFVTGQADLNYGFGLSRLPAAIAYTDQLRYGN